MKRIFTSDVKFANIELPSGIEFELNQERNEVLVGHFIMKITDLELNHILDGSELKKKQER